MKLLSRKLTLAWQTGMIAVLCCAVAVSPVITTGCSKINVPETVAIINAVGSGAINALQIAATLQGKPIPQSEIDQINKDTALAVSAFTDWSNQSTTTTLQKFQAAMQVLSDYLGPILQAARVLNPTLAAAAGLILSEIQSLIAIIVAAQPQTPPALHSAMKVAAKKAQAGQLLSSRDFKAQLNQNLTAFGLQYAVK